MSYRFYARQVNMVMAPVNKPVKADVYIDNKKAKTIRVAAPSMYTVFSSKKYKEKELSVKFHGKVCVFAYTFG
jgi:hypothetical protein